MNKKLWIWYSAVLTAFTLLLLTVVLSNEYNFKKTILSSRLEGYTDIMSLADDYENIVRLFPDNIRATVIRLDGSVVFDSYESAGILSNHLSRPEIASCLSGAEGCSIRKSDTSGIVYIYYARKYNDVIIRAALPFELSQKRFLNPSWMEIITICLLFAMAVLAIMFISRRVNADADRNTDMKLQIQKKQMTNNIAHELRTPVTSIRGYLETLIQNPDLPSDKRAVFTERAYLQTLRLSELIRDISLITKIEEAPELLAKEYIGLRKITDEVIEEFTERIDKESVIVDNCIPEGISVYGNQTLLYAIFRNLVENSIRYAGKGIKIHTECSDLGDGSVQIVYWDNGKGVDDQYMERIFERFYRIPSEDAHKSEGSGLGLSIVRNAILFHGGTICASHHAPHGLCFTFTIKK